MFASYFKSSSAPLLTNTVRPGARYGFYPQQLAQHPGEDSKIETKLATIYRDRLPKPTARSKQQRRFLAAVDEAGTALATEDLPFLEQWIQRLRSRVYQQGITPVTTIQAFATVREVAARLLGMRLRDVQLLGGWSILEGMVAEMQTGEGKTLTATLPATTAAMSGVPVHIVTVNDYLAKRDAEDMRPVYEQFGLSVGFIQEAMNQNQRQAAYACDITYCSNKQLVFDYLKDTLLLQGCANGLELSLLPLTDVNFQPEKLLLRGLNFAIVDEADSILIDEARTPLILSQTLTGPDAEQAERKLCEQALKIAGVLHENEDFLVDYKHRKIDLTKAGKDHLDQHCEGLDQYSDGLNSIWKGQRKRNVYVVLALSSCYLYSKDQHYLIQDNKIKIIDEHTGRTMLDRSWQYGLQQMIEAKEGCDLTPKRLVLAQISYQHFFRRYWRLGGMTGTAWETRAELSWVYRLGVVQIPPFKKLQRWHYPTKVFLQPEQKWQAVVASIEREHKTGRPVLVGTESVEDSEILSNLLQQRGLLHRVLNARQDREEAEVIAQAGQRSAITISTQMAGRGTDIKPGEGVAALGGLHIIACQFNRSRRIDRQLAGRSARQGDPGSIEMMIDTSSLQVLHYLQEPVRKLLQRSIKWRYLLPQSFITAMFRRAQRKAETHDKNQRMTTMKADELQNQRLGFAGRKK